ncbi:MAG: class I SAM-dependent methyltransferase [Terriglobales bacterium]
MSVLDHIHGSFVFPRRVERLASLLACLIGDRPCTVLDVGCGDGSLDVRLMQLLPHVSIEGVDVLVRPDAGIPVRHFDGARLPFPDKSFDVVMFVDVLHHTHSLAALLAEARRVARFRVLIKDHLREGFLAGPTLRFMDTVGNARHGVALPFNYQPEEEWRRLFASAGMRVENWNTRLELYPLLASFLFDRKLHFLAQLGSE